MNSIEISTHYDAGFDFAGMFFTQACMPRRHFSGGSLGVLRGNEYHIKHFGYHAFPEFGSEYHIPVGDQSRFDIASITKAVVAILTFWAMDDGLFNLDSLAFELLGLNLKSKKTYSPTIRDLLTYSVRFYLDDLRNYSQFSGIDLMNRIIEAKIVNTGRFSYSNYAPIILGMVLEKVTGKKLDQLAQDVLFVPLGMADTTFRQYDEVDKEKHLYVATQVETADDNGTLICGRVHDELSYALRRPSGAAGIFSTANDLIKLSRFILDKGTVADRKIIKPELFDLIGVNYFTDSKSPKFGLGFGLWEQFETGFLGYTEEQLKGFEIGPNFREGAFFKAAFTGCMFAIFPKIDTAVTILTNQVHPKSSLSSRWKNLFYYSAAMTAVTGTPPADARGLWLREGSI